MKKILIAALLALTTLVQAGPLQNMMNRCQEVMEQGACRVALDPNDFPPRTIRINGVDVYFPNGAILFSGYGYMDAGLYIRLRAPIDARNPDGTYVMCQLIATFCPTGENDGSDGCRLVRMLWRAN